MTDRMVANITAFNCVHNYRFHHERDFFSFGTQAQYKPVGLKQYIISHRHSFFYLEDMPNNFLRNFGVYLTIGCHTERGNILIDQSNKHKTSIPFRDCRLFPVFYLINKVYFFVVY